MSETHVNGSVLDGQLRNARVDFGSASTFEDTLGRRIRLAPVVPGSDNPGGVIVWWDVDSRAQDEPFLARTFDTIVDALTEALAVVVDAVGFGVRSSGVVLVTGHAPLPERAGQ